MRAKPNKAILGYLLKLLALLVTCGIVSGGWSLHGAMAKKLRNSKEPFNPSGGLGFFSSTNAIDTYFETNDVPALIIPVKTKSEQYCFAWAYPYSGIDTTILYCYVGGDGWWVLYLEATLRRTPYNADVQFKPNGDYVDVIREGDLLLKIKHPPDKPVVHPKR